VRWGVEAVEDALAAVGLAFEERPVPARFATGAAAAASLRWYAAAPAPAAAAASGDAAEPQLVVADGDRSFAPLPELVVAGGYEAALRLFTITWPPPR